jgi:hypothetical protein
MIIPSGGTGSVSIKLPRWILYILGVILFLFLIILGYALYIVLNSTFEASEYKSIQQQSLYQQKAIKKMNKDLMQLQEDFQKTLEKEEKLRRALGHNKVRFRSYRLYKETVRKKVLSFNDAYNSLDKDYPNTYQNLSAKILFLKVGKEDLNHSFAVLTNLMYRYKARMASTPSIKPAYGRIMSGFGYRFHPILKTGRMHKGLDISSWIGAPIMSTADGITQYAGWNPSYGYIAIIQHDYGFRTIYAHCSALLVKKGQFVKKGQIIANMGSTGLSTGSHVHYEVRRYLRPLDPAPYLNLDMFTARTEIW